MALNLILSFMFLGMAAIFAALVWGDAIILATLNLIFNLITVLTTTYCSLIIKALDRRYSYGGE